MPGPNDKPCVFVYGTLRRDNRNEMSQLLAKQGRFIGMARFKGRLFLVANYPGAVDSDTPQAWVHGELYELPHNDAVLRRLDDYEGCGPQFPQPTLYRREKKTVVLEDGTAVEAWVYLYNRPTDACVKSPQVIS